MGFNGKSGQLVSMSRYALASLCGAALCLAGLVTGCAATQSASAPFSGSAGIFQNQSAELSGLFTSDPAQSVQAATGAGQSAAQQIHMNFYKNALGALMAAKSDEYIQAASFFDRLLADKSGEIYDRWLIDASASQIRTGRIAAALDTLNHLPEADIMQISGMGPLVLGIEAMLQGDSAAALRFFESLEQAGQSDYRSSAGRDIPIGTYQMLGYMLAIYARAAAGDWQPEDFFTNKDINTYFELMARLAAAQMELAMQQPDAALIRLSDYLSESGARGNEFSEEGSYVVIPYISALALSGNPDKALAEANRYLAANPSAWRVAKARSQISILLNGTAPEQQEARTRLMGETNPVRLAGDLLFQFTLILNTRLANSAALAFFRLAEALKPDDANIKVEIAKKLQNMDQYAASKDLLYTLLDDPDYWVQAAYTIAQGFVYGPQDYPLAEAQLRALINSDNEKVREIIESDALNLLGHVYRYQERFDESAMVFQQAFDSLADPKKERWRAGHFLFYQAIALEQGKRWQEAEESLLLSLAYRPKHPHTLNYLGYSWIDRGENITSGTKMLQTAVQGEPTSGAIADSLGWGYYKLGHIEDAVTWLERAIQLLPGDPIINDHLGDVYWIVGREREARYQWERALIFEPTPELEKVIRAKISGNYENILVPPEPGDIADVTDEIEHGFDFENRL